MRLVNRNPSDAEIELFINYDMYLLESFSRRGDDFKKYVLVKDMKNAVMDYKEYGRWPEFLMPHDEDVDFENYFVINLSTKEIDIHCQIDEGLKNIIDSLLI